MFLCTFLKKSVSVQSRKLYFKFAIYLWAKETFMRGISLRFLKIEPSFEFAQLSDGQIQNKEPNYQSIITLLENERQKTKPVPIPLPRASK